MGMKPVSERLHQHDAVTGARVNHLLRLSGVRGEWLFTENVLAALRSSNRPLLVQAVGQRYVDGFN